MRLNFLDRENEKSRLARAFSADGMIPDWHQNSDTADQVDVDVLEKTQNYIWKILHTLDQGA